MSDAKKYQIQELVARGGTAVLYRAMQTSLDRVVAVKKLHQHLTEDENFTRRFVLEAKAAASLDHENIVKIIDFGIEDGGYHMVMEFIEGESVRGILDKWKLLPIEVALSIAYNVCQGLEHAHTKGIVHRDIKPGNVMVTHTGRVKITDFGLAKLTQQTTQHTAANSILGTPLYMSPEQAFGESVDQRSDLFSLGTMVYEMVTGIQPFKDEHYMAVIQNIINKNAPHPSKFNIELPAEVQSLLSRSMNKSRDARFQSATDFRKAIEKYLGLRVLKEAPESLRQLLDADGETLVLPRTLFTRKRQRRLRRGFVVALVTATLFGAAGLAYSLGPEALKEKAQRVASWIEDNNPINTEPENRDPQRRMAATQSDLANPLLTALTPDSSSSVVSDSAVVSPDLANQPELEPAPVEEAAPAPVKEEPVQAEATPDTTSTAKDPVAVPAPEPPPAVVTTTVAPAREQEAPVKEAPPAETPKRIRKGWLSVIADAGTEVYIGGRYHGDASPRLELELPSGPHRIECRKPGYVTYRETVYITAGELSNRRIILEKLQGWLSLSTTAGAEVFVDGKLIGITPLGKPLKLGTGKHQVTVKKKGFNVWNNEITIRADETLPLRFVLSPIY